MAHTPASSVSDRTTAAIDIAAAAVGLAAAAHVVAGRATRTGRQVTLRLGAATAITLLARTARRDRSSLGLDPDDLRAGLAWGLGGAAVVAGGIAAAAGPGGATDSVRDERARRMTTASAVRYVTLVIPLGTVIPEELTFRGVLPALLRDDRAPAWLPGLISSLLFGLWHVVSFRDLVRHNPGARRAVDRFGRAPVLAVHTVGLAAAGGMLDVIRRRSGHLVGPALVHLAANATGFLGARRA